MPSYTLAAEVRVTLPESLVALTEVTALITEPLTYRKLTPTSNLNMITESLIKPASPIKVFAPWKKDRTARAAQVAMSPVHALQKVMRFVSLLEQSLASSSGFSSPHLQSLASLSVLPVSADVQFHPAASDKKMITTYTIEPRMSNR